MDFLLRSEVHGFPANETVGRRSLWAMGRRIRKEARRRASEGSTEARGPPETRWVAMRKNWIQKRKTVLVGAVH